MKGWVHCLNPPRGGALHQFVYWALANALSDQSGLKKRNLLSQTEVKGSRVTQACKQVEKALHMDSTSMRDCTNSVATTLARLSCAQGTAFPTPPPTPVFLACRRLLGDTLSHKHQEWGL